MQRLACGDSVKQQAQLLGPAALATTTASSAPARSTGSARPAPPAAPPATSS
jgi:hypothetical protein